MLVRVAWLGYIDWLKWNIGRRPELLVIVSDYAVTCDWNVIEGMPKT